jgi:hypothetical protein
MGFDLRIFNDPQVDAEYIGWLVDERSAVSRLRFTRLWDYYTNRTYNLSGVGTCDGKGAESGRSYVQAQECGLPARITGFVYSAGNGVSGGKAVKDVQRKEVVIENDIGWRINAAVDFLFGKPIDFVSRAPEGRKRAEIETILKAVFSANGAIGFFQDMAVLGGVYGFVDCVIRPGKEILERFNSSSSQSLPPEDVLQLAQTIDLELIEAPRALPILEENDYKKIRYYVQHFRQQKNAVSKRKFSLLRFLGQKERRPDSQLRREETDVTEIISATAWQRYEDEELMAEGEVPWGFLPVVHIQNIAQPYYYEGISDVELLIPLQDELNTRLSDRANRITFQSFKMYLGKGIEGFDERPVSPGRMWHTDNMEASIEEFGGDGGTPSEDIHIAEIREAMDKASGVTPVVAGVLKNKLGNLTSAVALRLTLMGMLAKTERKRFAYGEGIKKAAWMVLDILDKANIYKTSAADRGVEIIFPSPLPENAIERLKEAQIKKELGVPSEQLLRELGYEIAGDESVKSQAIL